MTGNRALRALRWLTSSSNGLQSAHAPRVSKAFPLRSWVKDAEQKNSNALLPSHHGHSLQKPSRRAILLPLQQISIQSPPTSQPQHGIPHLQLQPSTISPLWNRLNLLITPTNIFYFHSVETSYTVPSSSKAMRPGKEQRARSGGEMLPGVEGNWRRRRVLETHGWEIESPLSERGVVLRLDLTREISQPGFPGKYTTSHSGQL